MLEHKESSIRGRISRATLGDRVAIAKELANRQPLFNEGDERQKAVIRRSEAKLEEFQAGLRERGTIATGIFRSDMHLPYTNWPALHLYLLLVENIQPDYISGLNDFFDHTGYGRWPDTRTPAAKLWDNDIVNALRTAREIHAAERKAAPGHLNVGVAGNHDIWLFENLRKVAQSGYSEHNVAHFMEEMEKQGVLQFTAGVNKRENIVQLSPGLKWTHGQSAAANIQSVAKAVQNLCRGRDEEEGIFFYTVGGHTHRAGEVHLNGVKHWNSGTLGTEDPHYMKAKPHWNVAVVVNRFDPNSRYTEGDIVEFKRRGGHLVARYDGVDYDVPLES